MVEDIRYITQITGDNPEGKAQLDNFIDPYEKYPVIAVTSRLMSTGVDAKTCKLIVLDRVVGSMTEFKQIIGRGTRVREDCGKMYFTILDFRKNYTKFSDPDFDGDPVMIIDVPEDKDFPPEDEPSGDEGGSGKDSGETPTGDDGDDGDKRVKYHVKGSQVTIVNEKVEYLDANGRLITMSIVEYSRMNLRKVYPLWEDFRRAWLAEKKKQELLDQLEDDGVFIELAKDIVPKEDIDAYDLISYIGYDIEPLSKDERIDFILMSGYLNKFSKENQEVVKLLLEEYRSKDIDELRNLKLLKLPQFIHKGSLKTIVSGFGGRDEYYRMLDEVEERIYSA